MFVTRRVFPRGISIVRRLQYRASIVRLPLSARSLSVNAEQRPASTSKFEFQAETRSLLDIVAKSLYSEQEVFLRELISNASDALEKRRCEELTSGIVPEDAEPLKISIDTDKEKRRLIIGDTGIGMSREELIDILGTIARSGSREYVRTAEKGTAMDIIGQFGMGFYSSFMVADKVTVTSHKRGHPIAVWSWDGSDSFQVSDDGQMKGYGTRIELELKAGDASRFCDIDRLKEIINKYSFFVTSPILLNGDRVNTMEAIWMMESKDVDITMHDAFFKQLAKTHHQHLIDDRPQYTIQYKTDAPLNIRALMYVPSRKVGPLDFQSNEDQGLALYARRVLIKPKAKELLPRYLRFLIGVVDSEDVPLNLSREMLQLDSVILKLRRVLTDRIVNFFVAQMKKDRVKYNEFYQNYSLYFKEGICTETEHSVKEEIAKLLMFESSNLKRGTMTSLQEYVERMQTEQKQIFYLFSPSRHLAETSPYFELFKSRNWEVLFIYDAADELVLLSMPQYQMHEIQSIEKWAQKNGESEMDKGKNDDNIVIRDGEKKELLDWIKSTLGSGNSRPSEHPAMLTGHLNEARTYARFGKVKDQEHLMIMQPTLHISLSHPLIAALIKLRKEQSKTAELLIEQIYDNALVTSGLMLDSSRMIPRLTKLLTVLTNAPKSTILTP